MDCAKDGYRRGYIVQRYHLIAKINGFIHTQPAQENFSVEMDKNIASALAKEGLYIGAVPCYLERCAICAQVGFSLDVFYEAGTFVLGTSGQYSYYEVGPLYRVLKRFAPEQFKTSQDAVDAGCLEEVKYREWWQ